MMMAAEVIRASTINTQVSTTHIPGPQYPPHFYLAAE